MSSINQLVSEIAHSIGQADSVPVRRAIQQAIIHNRNYLIRNSYSNHNYTDKVLMQKFYVSVVDEEADKIGGTVVRNIKRTSVKVPRPVRLINNTPFHSVRLQSIDSPIQIPFVKEASYDYYNKLPGFCPVITYDYINGYIYIYYPINSNFKTIKKIVVESVFEYPHIITEDYGKENSVVDFDDEFLIPEDMIYNLKKLIIDTINSQIIRDTNVVPTDKLVE